MSNSTTAIILAGGAGRRVKSSTPKQFCEILGKPLLLYSLEVFQQNNNVKKIIIVSHPLYINFVNQMVLCYNLHKVTAVVAGGAERYLSSILALRHCENDPLSSKILIHDGVRPLVTNKIIESVLSALEHSNAVTSAIALTDSILVKTEDNLVGEIPERQNFMNIQTPQGFRLHTIMEAYQQGLNDDKGIFSATDDCGMVKHYLPKEKITIVEGSRENIKITTPIDFKILEQLLS